MSAPSSTRRVADRDGLAPLRRRVAQVPPLRRDEERALARRVARGDLEAKRRLIEANLGLVVGAAPRYRHRGVEVADLAQEGMLGLIRAAELFDHRRGVRFSTYAGLWIHGAISRALEAQDRAIPIPAPVGAARQALVAASEPPPAPDAVVIARERRAALARFLRALAPRERQVLRLRFGLEGGDEHSLAAASGRLGLSKESVRQREQRALRRLRHRVAPGTWRAWLDEGRR